MADAICWNTQKGSKEDYCERKFIPPLERKRYLENDKIKFEMEIKS